MTTNLEQALYAALSEAPKPADPRAFASEAGGCSRAIWWRIHGEPVTDPPPLSTLLAFAIGNAVHEQVAAAYRAIYADLCATEVSWEIEHVAGRADVLISSAGRPWHVVGIKSISPFEVKYLMKPKREHLLQLSLYALALGAMTGDLVYVNKSARHGETPLLIFRDVLNAQTRYAAEDEAHRMEGIATAETLPDPHTGEQALDPRGDAWNCRYCRWRTRCLAEVQA